MSTVSHSDQAFGSGKQPWTVRLRIPDMWASLAITIMWIAVTLTALFGPDFVATSNDGNSTTIPSGIILALFAWLGTVAVAKFGFGRREPEQK